MRILLAEDDAHVANAVSGALRIEGFEVDTVRDGEEALFLAEQGIHDAIVLDIMMPSMEGTEIAREIRKKGLTTPIIFTTAKDSIKDRVFGLEIGGDDYLVKPYALSELIARINALIRRNGTTRSGSHTMEYGKIRLDTLSFEASFDGHDLHLTQKEAEILEFLLANRGAILTRNQIIGRVWGYETDLGMGILDVHMHNLRKKLKQAEAGPVIKTVRNVGFMLDAKQG